MHRFLLSAVLFALPCSVAAQSLPGPMTPDPAQQAAQQARQAAQAAAEQAHNAALQAQRDSVQATQQAQEANRRATETANQNHAVAGGQVGYTLPPKISVKPGHYAGPVTVALTTPLRDATIYYTLDGWKPSTASQRYRGPIVIDRTATLSAIVVVPETLHPLLASAEYVIAGSAPTPQAEVNSGLVELPMHDGVHFVPKGVEVPLAFSSGATSQTAKVGDRVALSLTQDLRIGSTLVAAKGATATGTVVQLNRSGMGGAPGTLVIEPDVLESSFGPISLSGSVTKEGAPHIPNATFLIPVYGESQIFRHGAEAVIAPGASFVALVAKDTPITAQQDE